MILLEHESVLQSAVPRRDKRTILEWANGRVGMDRTRRRGERWHADRTPWVKEILGDYQDDDVRELVLMAAAGSAKTTPMQVAVCWQVANDPCNMAWITCNEDLAKDAATERLTPMLENTPDTAALLLPGARDKTLSKVRTKYCSIDIGAASAASTFEQRRYRVFVGDECRKWHPGALSQAQNRQIGYEDAKRAFCSTAGLVDDEFDKHFQLGNQAELMFPCMGCGTVIPFVWESKYSHLPAEYANRAQFKYDDRALWLQCAKCGHQHHETPAVKRYICEKYVWVDINPAASRRVRSYHWPIFPVPWSKWNDEILPKWKLAAADLRTGNATLLREFVQETLAESWDEGVQIEKKAIVRATYNIENMAHVDGKDWRFVFQTVDVGERDFWHLVQGWNPGAQTRILSGGQLGYWQDVKAIAGRFGLVMTGRDKSGLALGHARRVFLDGRYEDPNLQEVHRVCAEMGWTVFIGTDKDFFEVKGKDSKPYRFLYSEPRYFDDKTGVGGTGQIVGVEFSIATPTCQDVLDELIEGKFGKWERPELLGWHSDDGVFHPCTVFDKHLNNEPKIFGINKKTGRREYFRHRKGPQHLRDCGMMQIAAATMPGLIANPVANEKPQPRDTTNGPHHQPA